MTSESCNMSECRIRNEDDIISPDDIKAPSGIPPPRAFARRSISGITPEFFKCKHRSCSAKTSLYLIEDQQCTCVGAFFSELCQENHYRHQLHLPSPCTGSIMTQAVFSSMRSIAILICQICPGMCQEEEV